MDVRSKAASDSRRRCSADESLAHSFLVEVKRSRSAASGSLWFGGTRALETRDAAGGNSILVFDVIHLAP